MRMTRVAALAVPLVASILTLSVQRAPVGGGGVAVAATPIQSGETGKGSVTPWGDPDLEGIWSPGYYLTPLERPDAYGGREFLTDQEVATLEREQAENKGRNTRLEAGSREDLEGAYNDAFTGRGTQVIRTKRTSLIVDPPDGKIPPLTPAAQAKRAAASARRAPAGNGPGSSARRGASAGYAIPLPDGGYPSDNPEDRPPDRCLGVTLPFLKGTSGAFSRIVQTPHSVAIYHEDGHVGGAYREVFLDGRQHLPPAVRQWLGDSIGRWDGKTLVADTTNFTGRTNFQGSGENLHLVERFTRVSDDLLTYRITVDDSTVWSRPWTIELPLTRYSDAKNQIFEAACHEGNYAMTSILAGARARDREAKPTAK
jgi:hypothetical protein